MHYHYRLACEVALPISYQQSLQYEIKHLESIKIGSRVEVEVGKQKKMGIIIKLMRRHTSSIKLKPILNLFESVPTFTPEALKELMWVSSYYHIPLGEIIFSAFPSYLKKRGSIKKENEFNYVINSSETMHLRGSKQIRVIELLKRQPMTMADLRSNGIPRETVKNLEAKNFIAAISPISISPSLEIKKNNLLRLNNDQVQCLKNIKSKSNDFYTHLIYGVTGSGKTEIYLNLIDFFVKQKKQVLLMVPEISLTPQLLNRMHARFHGEIGVYHSKVSEKQKYNVWKKLKMGEISCVIGTRSSAFLQFNKLGAIIIDEEHDSSFNQKNPYAFSAKNILIKKASIQKIPIILGSATPSLESLFNIKEKQFILHELPDRTGTAKLPSIRLIDKNNHKEKNGFTILALQAIKEHLANKNQIFIYVNRKGFAPICYCTNCNLAKACNWCSSRLVYYKRKNIFKCQICNKQEKAKIHCDQCVHDLKFLGQGTEQVKDFITEKFPLSRVGIIDSDIIDSSQKLDLFLSTINEKKLDIIIGTQLFSKGHDFKNITLAIILDADQGIYGIDFRSHEKLLQQLFQVSGRSGRGEKGGEVLVQTYNTKHPIFSYLLKQDYIGASRYLLDERAEAHWPPFHHLAAIICQSKSQESAFSLLNKIKQKTLINDKRIKLLGPASNIILKRKGMYGMHLLIQSSDRKLLNKTINDLKPFILNLQKSNQIRIQVDPHEI